MVRYRGLTQTTWDVSPLKDVSRDGARLVCQTAFEPGVLMELRLGLPLFQEPVSMPARVVWQQPVFSGRLRMVELGVIFSWSDASARERMEHTIQRLLTP